MRKGGGDMKEGRHEGESMALMTQKEEGRAGSGRNEGGEAGRGEHEVKGSEGGREGREWEK